MKKDVNDQRELFLHIYLPKAVRLPPFRPVATSYPRTQSANPWSPSEFLILVLSSSPIHSPITIKTPLPVFPIGPSLPFRAKISMRVTSVVSNPALLVSFFVSNLLNTTTNNNRTSLGTPFVFLVRGGLSEPDSGDVEDCRRW